MKNVVSEHAIDKPPLFLPPPNRLLALALGHIRDGRFQRSLSLVVAATSLVSGIEVGYEHYKGSYSNPVMYSPVILSGTLAAAGLASVFSGRAARTFLRVTSAVSLVNGIVGLGFHIRGIARKPGGWRLPVVNIVMGPPIFAPLLFGTSAYLGLLASYLRREDDPPEPGLNAEGASSDKETNAADWRTEISQGRFQKHLCVITIAWAFFSGFEALYSHYKSNFRYKAQWTPILLTPILMAAAAAAIWNRRAARTLLPVAASLALADGAVGFYYHARGIVRRPGGVKKLSYNILYGPPIFAPLLFAACGFLGILASLLRREPK
jgi:phosphate/sulfate permease